MTKQPLCHGEDRVGKEGTWGDWPYCLLGRESHTAKPEECGDFMEVWGTKSL